jgi:hypothetical protein
VDRIPRDLVTQNQLSNIAQRLCRLGRQTNQIVLANRHNLYGIGKLVTRCIALGIHADQLLTLLAPGGHYSPEELDEFSRGSTGRKVEIEAVFDLANVGGFFMGMVFEDELFEVEECAFMGNLLTDLDYGFPGVEGVCFCAVGTLLVGHDEFAFKRLLKDGRGKCFFLNREFDSDAAGVGFCPDEASVDETDFVEASEFLET